MKAIYLTLVALITLTVNVYSDNDNLVAGMSEAEVTSAGGYGDSISYGLQSTTDQDIIIKFDTLKYNPPRENNQTEELKPISSNNYGVSIYDLNTPNTNRASDLFKSEGKGFSFLNKFKQPRSNFDKWERWKVIGLYSAAIICNGIGDGMNNTHRKTLGHIFNAASIGMLVASPFVVKYDTKKWYWYLLTYTSLRLALFDATYNVTTKQPINFIGSTAITDKMYKAVGMGYDLSKTVGFVVGLTIPLRII